MRDLPAVAAAPAAIGLPSLRSSKSVLERDVPPILIVLASTSITEDVIYWNEPDLAVISCPVKSKLSLKSILLPPVADSNLSAKMVPEALMIEAVIGAPELRS